MRCDSEPGFEIFVGLPVTADEKSKDWVEVLPGDKTIAEITKLAKQKGLVHVRVWFPSTIGIMNFRTDRLNVYLDDSYKIERITVG